MSGGGESRNFAAMQETSAQPCRPTTAFAGSFWLGVSFKPFNSSANSKLVDRHA